MGFFESPDDIFRSLLQEIFVHYILPVILFFMAFLVLVFSHLPIVIRLVLVAVLVIAGLYFGGWLPW